MSRPHNPALYREAAQCSGAAIVRQPGAFRAYAAKLDDNAVKKTGSVVVAWSATHWPHLFYHKRLSMLFRRPGTDI